MKIKCISNKLDLDLNKINSNLPSKELPEFHITPDKEYTVYGMTFYQNSIWCYICDDAYTYYPRWNPLFLFSVIDNQLSRYWVFSAQFGKDCQSTYIDWNFPEWINEPYYYDSLTDGESREVEIFRYYKALMDLEFSNSSISNKAEIFDSQWLYCPLCNDGWVSTNEDDGMIICDNCKSILHNPRYRKKFKSFSEKENL